MVFRICEYCTLICSIWRVYIFPGRESMAFKVYERFCDPKKLRNRVKELFRALHTHIVCFPGAHLVAYTGKGGQRKETGN